MRNTLFASAALCAALGSTFTSVQAQTSAPPGDRPQRASSVASSEPVGQAAQEGGASIGAGGPSRTAAGNGVLNASPAINTVGEIIVTAQKRAQSINSVGLSITAVTGDQLLQQGITDTSQLTKIVPGFNFTETAFSTPVYTIRGVGFQESTLGASPAVSVYVDEVPLPFPIETQAASLDLERVEVLKGPQGTLFGENSTGGAVNYIAAKPTSTFKAGVDASYGRFDTTDVTSFVSGPVTSTLNARLSFRGVESGNYQKSYTSSATLGAQNRLEGRLLLDWRPIEKLKVGVNLSYTSDRSDTPASQLIGISKANPLVPLSPAFLNYPLAPNNDRAAGFDPGLKYRRDNTFYQGSIRGDYDLGHDMVATSITAYQRFTRHQLVDADGTPFQDALGLLTGSITTVFQEGRLAGTFRGKGSWLVGANYESDSVPENGSSLIADSTTAHVPGLSFNTERNTTKQNVDTYAGYGNFEYPVLTQLTLQGGVRYTEVDRRFEGCGQDYGDGQFAQAFNVFQFVLKGPAGVIPVVPGGCGTLSTPAFNPGVAAFTPGLVHANLNQNNVSWRTGLNWKPKSGLLLYVTVSQGYKSGSFPFVGAAVDTQFTPVTQESLLAYEGGFKATLLDRKLQLNGAGFYYDYTNKQIRGYFNAPIFGALESLVNIPKSHVSGFELSANWTPVSGLVISPAVTLVDSNIDKYVGYNPFVQLQDLSGEQFPDTPKWQAYLNAEYRHSVTDRLDGFAGGNLSYQSRTNGAVGNIALFGIPEYTLLDLRAGVESKDGVYRLTLYGRNVTDQFYIVDASRRVDVDRRFAGQPATYGFTLSYRFQ